MSDMSLQRARRDDARQLSTEASTGLRPLHDDLAELSPSFDGIVYFALDRHHKNNASAVATAQPESSDTDRFRFYNENIESHRVDLGSTALGLGMQLVDPRLLRSRMNPEQHLTWTQRTIVDNTLAGGLQIAYNTEYGQAPISTDGIERAWRKHEGTVLEMADAFNALSKEVLSIGDTLELDAPATPNAYIVSWDLSESTSLSRKKYPILRNYLLDMKRGFSRSLATLSAHVHDGGDGQDIAIWLPGNSEVFDRADKRAVRGFGTTQVLPLVDQLLRVYDEINKSYLDITPRVNFALGLGYVEHDIFDVRTSSEYWETSAVLKSRPSRRVSYTEKVEQILGAVGS